MTVRKLIDAMPGNLLLLTISGILFSGILQTECAVADQKSAAQPYVGTIEVGETDRYPVRLSSRQLPNLVQLHSRVISGGLPEGEAAFQELAQLGVKTIVSVDGAVPDVAAAARHGLRYVHLPHGYDGIPERRVQELALAVRDLEGRVYVHCHHGRHRSPAAASVACVAAGLLPRSQAVAVLQLAGTDSGYRGLYQSAQEAAVIDPQVLDSLDVQFREVVAVPPLAEAMVQLEHVHEQLLQIAAARYSTPADHPDLDPAHTALLLREQFTEMLRTEEVRSQPQGFWDLLKDSETAARSLESRLRSHSAAGDAEVPAEIPKFAARIARNCTDCHRQFRDVPLNEK